MTDDNSKKDPRSNHSNIPNREGGQGGQRRRRHHRHRRPPQDGAPRAENQSAQRQQHNESGPRQEGNTSRNSNRPQRHNRHRGPHRGSQNQEQNRSQRQQNNGQQGRSHAPQKPRHHLSPEERLVNLYWTHLEEYLQTRRAYHAHAHVENESQRIKYKRAYLRALEKWRTWQDGLNDHEKMVLGRRNYEHRLENSYSQKHQLVYDRTQIDWTGPFKDQHFLPRQIEANYQGDIEETSGTMEDYQRIKDGFVPAKYRET